MGGELRAIPRHLGGGESRLLLQVWKMALVLLLGGSQMRTENQEVVMVEHQAPVKVGRLAL